MLIDGQPRGWRVSAMRTYRLYCEGGLCLRSKRPKRHRSAGKRMRLPVVLLLLLLCVPATYVFAEPHVVVGRPDSGLVFYCGNELPRPYEVVLTYRVEGDTLWQGLYVNHLPVFLMPKETPAAPASSEEADSNSAFAREERFVSDVVDRVRKFPSGGLALQRVLEDVARSHNQRGRLVEWIRVNPNNSISVLFTGHPLWEYIMVGHRARALKQRANNVLIADALTLVRTLTRNWVVLIGPNGLSMTGPPSLAEDVRRLQRDASAESGSVINPDVLHDIRHPVTLRSVKRGHY